MRLSLKAKTIIGTAVIEGTFLLILVFTATRFMADIANDNLTKRAETTAKLFATTSKNAVLSYDLASLDSIVSEVMTNADVVYARVVNEYGEVFAKSGRTGDLSRPFVEDLNVSDIDDGVFDASSSIIEADTLYGRVEVGISVTQMQRSIAAVTRWTAGIALFEMLLVAAFSYVLGNYLTKQLDVLRKGAKNITDAIDSGQFDIARVPDTSQDELADVAMAFNSLVDNLEIEHQRTQSFQNALQGLNRTLESKVKHRTQQVELQNQELKQINQDLKSAQQQLLQSEKMASVGQLAAGVAHEINNPIGFINSNVSCLKNYVDVYIGVSDRIVALLNLPDDTDESAKEKDRLKIELLDYIEENDISFINEDIKELLADTDDGLKRVIDIVQNMKIFARADSDNMQAFDINQCIATTAKMVKPKVQQKAELILELNDLPKTILNVGRINQVLTNLMVNASQAIESKGTVTVKSAVVDDKIQIQVSDDGTGMDEETMKSIFNPFFTTKPEGEGTGLGLSISFEIMQEHGGSIDVTSKLGEGTTFTMVLPVQEIIKSETDHV